MAGRLCRFDNIHIKKFINFEENILDMEEEKIKNEKTAITEDIAQGPPTAREELETLLNEILTEEERTGDVDAMALNYIRKQKEMSDKLIEALSTDARFASAMVDIMNGKGGGEALVRHFGKGFINAQEGTPEWDEILQADKEWNDTRTQGMVAAEEYDKKAAAWFDAFDDYCNRMNLNADVYKIKVEDEFIIPVLEWEVSDKIFDSLVKAVDYDKDTEDAFAAGEIKGRNENINNMRAKPSDGLPKALGTQATITPERPKRKVNSFVASALKA